MNEDWPNTHPNFNVQLASSRKHYVLQRVTLLTTRPFHIGMRISYV